jgi:hypothetical protein
MTDFCEEEDKTVQSKDDVVFFVNECEG